MDKLGSIRVFLAIAASGSFAEAARDVGISRAMASKHIGRLEDDLGVRLLNRTTRSVSLTEAGAAYRDRVRDIVDDLDETEQSIAQLSSEPRGTLRVLAPTSFGSFHLARAVADYQRQYPAVSVDFVLTERPRDLVEEGLDLAIRIGALEESSLVARKLAQARVVVCASPGYLAERGRPRRPEELEDHNCLIYSARIPLGEWPFTIDGKPVSLKVSGSLRSSIGDAIRVAAIQGCGLAQLPTYMVGLDIMAGRLEPVLEVFEPPPRPIHAVYLHRRHLSAKVRTFVAFLAERFYPNPYWEQWTVRNHPPGPGGAAR
jgi:DNA-binding transcriptional LysR family regulator